jgi:hypothetical protein
MTAALGVVGRFGVSIAYNSGTQYAAELIPTEVRGQGIGLIHVAGYAATFFSPHILYLVRSGRTGVRNTLYCSQWHPVLESVTACTGVRDTLCWRL